MGNPWGLFISIIFSCVGSAYFVYGKKQDRWNFMIFGGILVFITYFINSFFLQFFTGAVLCLLPFLIDF